MHAFFHPRTPPRPLLRLGFISSFSQRFHRKAPLAAATQREAPPVISLFSRTMLVVIERGGVDSLPHKEWLDLIRAQPPTASQISPIIAADVQIVAIEARPMMGKALHHGGVCLRLSVGSWWSFMLVCKVRSPEGHQALVVRRHTHARTHGHIHSTFYCRTRIAAWPLIWSNTGRKRKTGSCLIL